ncbi:MAG: SDR family oxidoreductase [Desulfobacterales bacterium]|nr:SDR family oxidoreductase [Desulfobacterales bacterium]
MHKRNFQDNVVVVTGGASGIGLATAKQFARAGACCVLLDLDEQGLEQRKNEFAAAGLRAETRVCDVSSKAACDAAIQSVIRDHGGIDVLFNNAGITQRSRFADTRVEVFRRVMEVNFFGALYCTRAAIDSLIARRGMIIVNESIAGVAPLVGRTGYGASKHALHGLFTSLRAEIRHLGVHIMIVCPGFVRTRLQDRALGADGRVTDRPQSFVGPQDTPENAAAAIYQGACREKTMLVLTFMGKLGYLISRLAPGFYERQMTRRFRTELEGE